MSSNEGVTEAVVRAVAEALHTRELIKIKLQESAPLGAREAADRISAALRGSHPVQVIGRTAVLYRPDPDEPEIDLPDPAS